MAPPAVFAVHYTFSLSLSGSFRNLRLLATAKNAAAVKPNNCLSSPRTAGSPYRHKKAKS
jgi:hypothetical protein